MFYKVKHRVLSRLLLSWRTNVQHSAMREGRALSSGPAAKRQRTAAASGKPPLPPPAQGVAAPAVQRGGYLEPGEGTTQLGNGAEVTLRTDLLRSEEAASLYRKLRDEVPWEAREIQLFGKPVMQPRLIAYMADGPEMQYSYSGATVTPTPWHPAVAALKQRVEAASAPGVTYNAVLLNYYRSGADSMGWHADSEGLYGLLPNIGSVSLGTPREFLVRRITDHSEKYRFWLGNGAMLTMAGTMQQHFQHSVPRRDKEKVGGRINLTFRRILFPEKKTAAQ